MIALEKVILKVKQTGGFLKVTCRKCDRGLQNGMGAPSAGSMLAARRTPQWTLFSLFYHH